MKNVVARYAGMMIAVAIFVMPLWFSCTGGQSEEDIARDLSNKLTDGMNFSGGTVKSGFAPSTHENDPAYPQVTNVAGSTVLTSGQKFNYVISSLFTGDVKGAVVQVAYQLSSNNQPVDVLATEYIQVTASFSGGADGSTMTLQGTPQLPSDVAGKTFQLFFGILRSDGSVGNYFRLAVQVAGGGADGGATADSGAPNRDGGISGPDGGSALTCSCTQADCESIADCNTGITFTPLTAGCDSWSDRNKCSAWYSVVMFGDGAGVWPDTNMFSDGTQHSMENCTIKLTCPKVAY